MFRITRDSSSWSFIQCLAKITVMVLLCPLTWTRSVLWQHICPWCVCVLHCASLDSAVHTHTHHGQIWCHNTDYVHVNGRDRTITAILDKHCTIPWWWIPCDPKYVGSFLNSFKYFIIILIVSMNYIFVHLLDRKVF
jgi:hypothetical protein